MLLFVYCFLVLVLLLLPLLHLYYCDIIYDLDGQTCNFNYNFFFLVKFYLERMALRCYLRSFITQHKSEFG